MSGMWCFYSASYKLCSEGKLVNFLPGSFLLLSTAATENFVATFLQKLVLISGKAQQDCLCCLEELMPMAWHSHWGCFAASLQHILNTHEPLERIRWRHLQNNIQFNHTQRNPTFILQKGSGMKTQAQWVKVSRRFASKTHCRSELRGYGRHTLWHCHLFCRCRNHTHRG